MNSRQRLEAALLLVILLSAGGTAWWLNLQQGNETDPTSLDTLPYNLNGWASVDIEIDQSVSDMLRADHHVQRAYQHRQGYLVYVYVGYYGTERGGAPDHTPEICYPSQGWRVRADEEFQIGRNGEGLLVREFIIAKGDESRLVHFWYRTETDSGFTSTISLKARQFWGRLTANRGDGALVRVSTPIMEGGLSSARGRLLGLDEAVETALDEIWPQSAETV